ncbi:MAG: dienelactone hydrolase family protein [Capsulimonadales bacterium]|nr:dienelactone hydrolase family protein [Capsulimonadales bacterium]
MNTELSVSRKYFLSLVALAVLVPLTGCGGGSSKSDGLSSVGRTAFDWTDTGRAEKWGPTAGSSRKIAVYFWYPATKPANATPGPFLDTNQSAAVEPVLGIPAATIRSFPTKSYINAAPTTGRAFPVLVMSHGNGMHPLLYNSTAEYLAARGYLVVGVAHTYNAAWTLFSDNSLAVSDAGTDPSLVEPQLTPTSGAADFDANWRNAAKVDQEVTADLPFVLDKLAALNAAPGAFQGRIDLDRVGVFGHSFGGSHAFRMLREDSRVRAAAVLDGSLINLDFAEGANRPLLIFAGERSTEAENAAFRQTLIDGGMTASQADVIVARGESDRKAFENSTDALYIRLTKARHSNFTDLGLLAAYGVPQDDISTTAPAAALLDTMHQYLVGFFNEKLRGQSAPILRRTPGSPDVTLETRP